LVLNPTFAKNGNQMTPPKDLTARAGRSVIRQGGVLRIKGDGNAGARKPRSAKYIQGIDTPERKQKRQYKQGRKKYARLLVLVNSISFDGVEACDFVTLTYGKHPPSVPQARKHFNELLRCLRNRKLLGKHLAVIEFGPDVHFHLLLWSGSHSAKLVGKLRSKLSRLWKSIVGAYGARSDNRLVDVIRGSDPKPFASYMAKKPQKRFDVPGQMHWSSHGLVADAILQRPLSAYQMKLLRYMIGTDMELDPKRRASAWMVAVLPQLSVVLDPETQKDYLQAVSRLGGSKDYRLGGLREADIDRALLRIAQSKNAKWRRR
jgi:hypothetical protein